MPKIPGNRVAYLCLTLLWLSFSMYSPAQEEDEFGLLPFPKNLAHEYGVIGIRVSSSKDRNLRVRALFPQGPGELSGVQVGDEVLGVRPFRARTGDQFSRCVKSHAPGDSVTLLIRRDEEIFDIVCPVGDRFELYFLMSEEFGAKQPDLPSRLTRMLDLEEGTGQFRQLMEALVARQGVQEDWRSLVDAFVRETNRYGADRRLADVQFALHHPLSVRDQVAALGAEIESAEDFRDFLIISAQRLSIEWDFSAEEEFARDPLPTPTFEDILVKRLFDAAKEAVKAFEALSDDERDHLFRHVPVLLQHIMEENDLGEQEELNDHIEALRLAKRVKLKHFWKSAAILAPLTTDEGLLTVKEAAANPWSNAPLDPLPSGFRGDFRYARKTDLGWILVGDRGPNFYGEDAAAIVDLGGDDIYFNNTGSALMGAQSSNSAKRGQKASPVGIIIDFEGSDRYLGNGFGELASAFGGVSLLIDIEGDDTYQGDRLTQGSVFCGIAMLWDLAGSDTYLAQALAQASAYFGFGLLHDRSGNDLFVSPHFGQGFGGPHGMGLLVDRGGNDRYLADRKIPSGYGTSGVYDGWSQGVGRGIRGYLSGGLGVLFDAAGEDEYQAGNFSQGTGYFFALGALIEKAGNDIYRGSRYSQGASAHQAVGVLLESSGNDRYSGRVAANQAGAWDIGIAILEDLEGNDRYSAGGFAQAAAAMNSFALLYDAHGQDRFEAGKRGQGVGGSTAFWGGRGALNLAIFLDTGGSMDDYSREDRENASEARDSKIAVFIDH